MSDRIEPKQQRSRETLTRLLKATVAVLEAQGLEGATIPRIAHEAGVAPASVYRRFTDKDALIRAALLDELERSNVANAAAVAKQFEGRSLEWVAHALARSLIAQYRARPGLIRALVRFGESDGDAAFVERALALMGVNVRVIAEAIASRFAAEIADPQPLRAVTFATLAIANIAESVALDQISLWRSAMPLDDDAMQKELARLFLGYLRVEPL
ncbi:MAG: TetR/AcrR family transcriptional regulator [bacterium]|nr:TetR/AcrR family transcriptional regulator [bacterium]